MGINLSPPRWQPTVIDALRLIGIDLNGERAAPRPSLNGHRTNGTRPVMNRAPT
jgi:hypothetical protein